MHTVCKVLFYLIINEEKNAKTRFSDIPNTSVMVYPSPL